MYKFNSRTHKQPFGAVRAGEKTTITFPVTHSAWVHSVNMILRKEEWQKVIPLSCVGDDGNTTYFQCEFSVEDWGIYYYRFEVQLEGGGVHYIGASATGDAIQGDFLPEWQLTVFAKDYQIPKTIEGGVIYHIFVDRFCKKGADILPRYGVLKKWGEPVTIIEPDGTYKANDFYGGNLQGIISKLDYLKSLGVTDIYLSPIFEASSNHRYDTGDYMKIDGLLGDESDFKDLISEGGKRGIGIILDGVFNHSGADSIYFNQLGHYDSIGATQSKDSPYYEWYYFKNYPHDYDSWWGCKVVPTFNKGAQGYRKFLFGEDGVISKWTDFGIAGWRLDVVDELPTDFVNELRATIKRKNKNAVIIGEVWEDASVKVSYGTLRPYFTLGQLDGVMNYPFKEAIIAYVTGGKANDFCNKIMLIAENYPHDALNSCMTLLGSHDTVRILNQLSGVDVSATTKEQRKNIVIYGDALDIARRRLKIASLLQFILPGVPSVYYGDEAGMQGYEDPLNRGCYPWGHEDSDMIKHYQMLGNLRQKFKQEIIGGISVIEQGELLIMHRFSKDKHLYAVINSTFEPREFKWQKSIDIATGATICEDEILKVDALSYRLFEV